LKKRRNQENPSDQRGHILSICCWISWLPDDQNVTRQRENEWNLCHSHLVVITNQKKPNPPFSSRNQMKHTLSSFMYYY